MTTTLCTLFLATLFYSIAERKTRDMVIPISAKRVGGITFVRVGRLNFGYSFKRKG